MERKEWNREKGPRRTEEEPLGYSAEEQTVHVSEKPPDNREKPHGKKTVPGAHSVGGILSILLSQPGKTPTYSRMMVVSKVLPPRQEKSALAPGPLWTHLTNHEEQEHRRISGKLSTFGN